MTRIIGGEARGRRLRTPTGRRTRPTSDRVREALFSAVESTLGSLDGTRFLDVYAGSGAVGLEARSRGSAVVTLVEQDRSTAAVIGANARALGFTGVEVLVGSAERALGRPPGAAYDVVFLDPPYRLATTAVEADLHSLLEHGWLLAGSLVVVERGSKAPAPGWPPGIEADRERSYGETTLWYGRATGPTEPTV